MPKHDSISQALRAEIAAGEFGSTGRLPSEAQLVERFGVSRPTVARALRDLQADGLITRRAGSGTFVRQRATGDDATRVLGLLVPERGTTEVLEAICGELGSLARVHGFGLLWGGSPLPHGDRDATPEHALEVCRQFVDKSVAGVFFAPLEGSPQKDELNREMLERLRRSGIPVILLDRDVAAFPQRTEYDLVCLDNFAAGYFLAEHLIRLGCRRLRFLARPDSAPTVDARIGGVRHAMANYHLGIDPKLVAVGDPANADFIRALQPGKACDGMICANDLTAAELMKTATALHVDVPAQLRVVGFDDVRYASLLSVTLTTIRQPCRDIAHVAFRAMQERLHDPAIPPRMLSLAPRLVIRESCGNYLAESDS